jgi:hypothetical protein
MKRGILLFLLLISIVQAKDEYLGYCGNGVKDFEETSDTCCVDVGCPLGHKCVLNMCFENIEQKETKIMFQLLLSIVAIIGIVLTIQTVKKYINIRKIRKDPRYYEYVNRLRSVLIDEEAKGLNEKQIQEDLAEMGWKPEYIEEARKKIKHEKKLLKRIKGP